MYSLENIIYIDVGRPVDHRWSIENDLFSLPVGVKFDDGEYVSGLSVQDTIDRINQTLE